MPRRRILFLTACLAALVAGPIGAEISPEEHRDHWAWAPLQKPATPKVKAGKRVATPVDAFVLAGLEAASVELAQPADPGALLRRVYLDLIGLPPGPEEVRAFLKDPSDKNYARVVDELLARPQYGERWGRHWLDVVRYAETKGYERDEFKKFVWRYRDYVIDAFNNDIPYDQFVLEQLAGDELEGADVRTQIATTFLSLGTFDTIAADGEVARYDTLDDIVATTSMAFLGQTIHCARCHDHKFEPISQVDYYRMLAAFESLDVTKKERQIGSEEDLRRHREAEERFVTKVLSPARAVEEEHWLPLLERLKRDGPPEGKKPRIDDKRLDLAITAIKTKPAERGKDHLNTLERERGRIRGALRDMLDEAGRTKLAEVEKRVSEAESKRPQPMMAWTYPDRGGPKPGVTHLRVRGEVHEKGEEVSFGIPVVLDSGGLAEPVPTKSSSGRRRALAEWITGPAAPLAARVMANRVWQHHFGRGLVGDSNNLGISGGEATHPELLEWLAAQLVEGGWKLKPLHRQIVLSSTYRASAEHPSPDSDSGNALYSRWPIHRLEAEAIRDSVLAASGKLNLKMAGPSIYPTFDGQVVGASSKSDWSKSPEEEASRRSVYVFAKRAIPLPELAVLGSPDSSASCAQRTLSTTAVQALLMMNGRFATEQSKHLAERLKKEAGDEAEAQISRAFELVLCRAPREEELKQSAEFLEAAAAGGSKIDPLEALCLVLFNTNEFAYRN